MKLRNINNIVQYCGYELGVVSSRTSSIDKVAYVTYNNKKNNLEEFFDIRPLNGAFIYETLKEIPFIGIEFGGDLCEVLTRLDDKLGEYVPYWLRENEANKILYRISEVLDELLEEFDSGLEKEHYQTKLDTSQYVGRIKPYRASIRCEVIKLMDKYGFITKPENCRSLNNDEVVDMITDYFIELRSSVSDRGLILDGDINGYIKYKLLEGVYEVGYISKEPIGDYKDPNEACFMLAKNKFSSCIYEPSKLRINGGK